MLICGCIPTTYACKSDDNCQDRGVQGACEATGYCSYPDEDCPSRRRYDVYAPAALARQCVDDPEPTTTESASTSSGATPMETATSADTGGCEPAGCADQDGDCHGDGPGCLGPDCDDANPAHHDLCFYVAPDGDDAADGSASTPWLTFERALSALSPGTSLVLLDGAYPLDVHGALHIDCDDGTAVNGTSDAPIVVRAQNERQAMILADGVTGITVKQCAYWSLVGLTARGGDRKPSEGGSNGLIKVLSSTDITLARILAATSNRYHNDALYTFYESNDVLVEECEAHDFHRWAFLAWRTDRVFFRRVFVDAGQRADLAPCPTSSMDPDAPFCTSAPGGDSGFSLYSSVTGARIENCIVQGPVFEGVSVGSRAVNVTVAGSIFLGGPGYGINTPYQTDDAATRLTVSDTLVINPNWGGIYLGSPSDAQISGMSVINSKDDGVEIYEDIDGAPCSAQLGGVCTVDVDRTLVLDSANEGFSFTDPVDWSLRDSIAYGNGVDFPSGDAIDDDAGRITHSQSVPAGIGIGPGQCAVYIPDDSPAAGAAQDGQDIGATILTRIEEGPTDEPLWDPTTGAFPCGAEVEGINDNPEVSCATVHTRLNVFSNGCPRPPD